MLNMSRLFTTDAMLQLEARYTNAACSVGDQSVTPAGFLDEAVRLVAENSNCGLHYLLPREGQKLAVWNGTLECPDSFANFGEAEELIKKFLATMGDPHAGLRNKSQTKNSLKALHYTGAVTSRFINDAIGYIKVDNLVSRLTGQEFVQALDELATARCLIIDLRDNRGGYLDQVELIYSALVRTSQGVIYSVRGLHEGRQWEERICLEPGNFLSLSNQKTRGYPRGGCSSDKPIVVLVNDETRSAAELLARALSYCGRAQTLGARTYGKNTLQQTIALSRGFTLRVTSAKFKVGDFTVGSCVITPDHVVAQDLAGDNQLVAAIKLLRRA